MPSCGQAKRRRIVEANCLLAEIEKVAQSDAFVDPPLPSSQVEDAAAEGAQRQLRRQTAAAAAAVAGAGAPTAQVPAVAGAAAEQANTYSVPRWK